MSRPEDERIKETVMIALTGTPLIGNGYNTKDVFGAYIHKYYYNDPSSMVTPCA